MDLKLLEKLSNAVSIGHICEARDIAKRELSKYAEVTPFGQIGLIAKINKGKDKTLLLDAHIDEVGFIVTGILGNIIGEMVCKVFRIKNPISRGLALGTSAHAIGTARAMEMGEVEGAMSSLAIVVTGIMTVVIVPIVMGIIS